jgi:predicted secreted protein
MTTAGALVTFVVVWWLIFFMALPFGAAPEERPRPGNVESAPARPRLLLKAAITTVLAALATWAIAWFIASGMVELRPRSAALGCELPLCAGITNSRRS